jgi:UDP-2-acetamido-2,6-beta-L-arabino-hexul-4-ose reductase
MRIVITGSDGFIGKNLSTRLIELGHTNFVGITRSTPADEVAQALANADFVFHLAGTNRPLNQEDYKVGNGQLTENICSALILAGRHAPVVLASSTQVKIDNPYGLSKLAAEDAVLSYAKNAKAQVYVFRLPNVFGKWSRPNYNSVVATFCHNTIRGLPIKINDPASKISLVYIDDVITALIEKLKSEKTGLDYHSYSEVKPIYDTTVGELAIILRSFYNGRSSLKTERVGKDFLRALYSTYVSYLTPELFAYSVPCHSDPRGSFVEMLKTEDSGQFSYFTAHPGVTRGEHYHHTKTEKFLVIKGTAHFGFRNIVSNQTHEIVTYGGDATIVETIPGWTHNITNIGSDELIVMLWANEVFQPTKPDTISMRVKP